MRNIFKNLKRGFTLIELMVTIAIFMIITAVVLVNNSRFNNSVVLTSAAYEVALSIREAQNAALNVRSTDGTSFDSGYGVFIPSSGDTTDNTYTFYSDYVGTDPVANGFGFYTAGQPGSPDVNIKDYIIRRGFYIDNITGFEDVSGATEQDILDPLTIAFKRPDTLAYIYSDNGSLTKYKSVTVCLTHPSDTSIQSCIEVNKLGLISVKQR